MKKQESLKLNAIYNTIYQVLTIITPFITTPYVSRVLGPSGTGTYSYTQSYANYFFLFAMLGVNNYGNRRIAQYRDNRKDLSDNFWQIYYIQFFDTLIILPLYVAFVYLFTNPANRVISLVQGLQVVSVFFDINWLLFGLEKFKISTIRNIIVKIFTVVSIFIFVRASGDVWKYALIIVLGTIIGVLVIWPTAMREVDFEWPNFAKMRKHFKPNFILFLPLLASGIYQYVDTIMLGMFTNSANVGYYTYASNLINVPSTIVTGICTVIMPRMSYLVKNSNDDTQNLILEKTMKFVFIFSVAMACGLISVADSFIPIYLGPKFHPAIYLLQLLSLMLPVFVYANAFRMVYLIPNEDDTIYIVSIITGAVLDIIGNYLLIHVMNLGAVGACLATMFASTVAFLLQVIYTWKELPYLKWIKQYLPFVLSGLIMMAVIYGIKMFHLYIAIELIVSVIVGAIIFIATSIAILFMQKDTMMTGLIGNIIRRKS